MAAGEELLELGGDPVGIGGPGRVGCAVNHEVPRGSLTATNVLDWRQRSIPAWPFSMNSTRSLTR
jgi:hypothetical protein